MKFDFKVWFFRLEHSSFPANFENVILGCTMTTLEPKSTSLFSQLILRKPDGNGQYLSGKVSNIGPKTLHMSKEKENRVIYASKSRKNPEKIILIYFHMLIIKWLVRKLANSLRFRSCICCRKIEKMQRK